MSTRSRLVALAGLLSAGLVGLLAWLDRMAGRAAVGPTPRGRATGTALAGDSHDARTSRARRATRPRPVAEDGPSASAEADSQEGDAGQAERPGLLSLGRRLVGQVKRDDIVGLSAELAYRFFLALFPFAIFLTSMGSFVAANLPIQDPTERIIGALQGALPAEAATLVGNEIRDVLERRGPGLLSFSALIALFFATGGMNAIIKSMNRTYGVEEERSFWKRYMVAIVLTLVAGAFIIAAFALLVPAQILAADIAQALGLGEAGPLIVTLGALVTAFVFLTGAVSLLYRTAPNLELPVRAIVPGALFFVVAWIAMTLGFGFYVSNFGNYNATYGALAGVAIALIWFYASAFVLLLGTEINDIIHELGDPADLQRRRRASAARNDDSAENDHEDRTDGSGDAADQHRRETRAGTGGSRA